MKTNHNKNMINKNACKIGPTSDEIPIIASSLINMFAETIDNHIEAYDNALDILKECGFNGLIGEINFEKQGTHT